MAERKVGDNMSTVNRLDIVDAMEILEDFCVINKRIDSDRYYEVQSELETAKSDLELDHIMKRLILTKLDNC